MVSIHAWSWSRILQTREELELIWGLLNLAQACRYQRWFLWAIPGLSYPMIPTFSCLFSRKEIIPSPLCPCGEDVHHYCFACPLLPPPSPTYAEIFKSKTPSKLKPIASLLCEKVMTYSNKFLPSYETKMKFLQGIIIQAVLTNLILFLVQLFHPNSPSSLSPQSTLW